MLAVDIVQPCITRTRGHGGEVQVVGPIWKLRRIPLCWIQSAPDGWPPEGGGGRGEGGGGLLGQCSQLAPAQ